MRPNALDRKNYLFMGSAGGGKAVAIAYTLACSGGRPLRTHVGTFFVSAGTSG